MAPSQSLSSLPAPPASFIGKKAKIIQQLAVSDAEYTDLSPKGSVDVGIRDLITELNAVKGLVTTSSCAGRVSVFLEGQKGAPAEAAERNGGKSVDQEAGEHEGREALTEAGSLRRPQQTQAGVGGKGGGGTWLFVSHDPVDVRGWEEDDGSLLRLFGLQALQGTVDASSSEAETRRRESSAARRFVHFKFEPMILHVLTASPSHAQLLLKCALQSGFRESGAINILPSPSSSSASQPTDASATPMVAVRTNGLAFESLVGVEASATQPDIGCHRAVVPMVSPQYLRTLLNIGNERFAENAKRIARFREELRDAVTGGPGKGPTGKKMGAEWEDTAARRERKREEGLRRKAEIVAAGESRRETTPEPRIGGGMNVDTTQWR